MKPRDLPLFLLLLLPVVSGETCTGDLIWKEDGTVCIATCTAHFYPDDELCPTRTIGRCVCPEGKIKLDDTEDICVAPDSAECQEATKKYMDNPSKQFKFAREPEDATLEVGDSVTLTCLVSNAYTIQYIWYKLDELPQGDSTAAKNLYMTGTSTLVFVDITPEESGFYQCKAVADKNFLMISGVGNVKVKHFTTGEMEETEERVTKFNPLIVLKCVDIYADPIPSITWFFMGEQVDYEQSNYFVNNNRDSKDYGSLYIQNVVDANEGAYVCRGTSDELGETKILAKRTLNIHGSQNTVSGAPKVAEEANHGDRQNRGREGSMYCAGYGYPAPEILWYKVVPIGQQEIEIRGCTESICVSKGGRKMTMYLLKEEDFGQYRCEVRNSYGTNTKIMTMDREPESYEVTFKSISPPVKIYPNRYASFTLTCVVDTSQNPETYMGWYQNTQGIADKGERIRINSKTVNGQSVQELVFDYPTNEDHGVFQCLAYNSKTFRQSTTDVYVYMSKGLEDDYNMASSFASEMYDPTSAKTLKYFPTPRTAAEAEYSCKNWKENAHLASILNYDENDEVFEQIMGNKDETNETRAWIGLTDEAGEGIWNWLSGEVSSRFCFWWKNHPDNSESNRDYAYMDAAKSGHWLDGDHRTKLPYVCKHYSASCIDLTDQSEADISFDRYAMSSVTGSISVYDKAVVRCTDGNPATLVCAPSGRWVLEKDSVCPEIGKVAAAKKPKDNSQSGSASGLSHQHVVVLLILCYLFRT